MTEWLLSTSGSFYEDKFSSTKNIEENADLMHPEVDFLNISLKSACFKDNCLRLLKVECKKNLVNCGFIACILNFSKHTLQIF